jgi:hypothetical protein
VASWADERGYVVDVGLERAVESWRACNRRHLLRGIGWVVVAASVRFPCDGGQDQEREKDEPMAGHIVEEHFGDTL